MPFLLLLSLLCGVDVFFVGLTRNHVLFDRLNRLEATRVDEFEDAIAAPAKEFRYLVDRVRVCRVSSDEVGGAAVEDRCDRV